MNWFNDLPTIYLHRSPVDFRKAVNGLCELVQDELEMNPFDENLYVFCNRKRDRLKILHWDRTGFVLWYKRLEKEKFKWPVDDVETVCYDRVKELKFSQFQNLFRYLEGYTPFSTQHKIKGSQFDHVLVVMDNGNWSMYNFEYILHPEVFESLSDPKKRSFANILNRTQKLFYVCCTRSKEELAIYYHAPSDGVLAGARALFGDENVVCI